MAQRLSSWRRPLAAEAPSSPHPKYLYAQQTGKWPAINIIGISSWRRQVQHRERGAHIKQMACSCRALAVPCTERARQPVAGQPGINRRHRAMKPWRMISCRRAISIYRASRRASACGHHRRPICVISREHGVRATSSSAGRPAARRSPAACVGQCAPALLPALALARPMASARPGGNRGAPSGDIYHRLRGASILRRRGPARVSGPSACKSGIA